MPTALQAVGGELPGELVPHDAGFHDAGPLVGVDRQQARQYVVQSMATVVLVHCSPRPVPPPRDRTGAPKGTHGERSGDPERQAGRPHCREHHRRQAIAAHTASSQLFDAQSQASDAGNSAAQPIGAASSDFWTSYLIGSGTMSGDYAAAEARASSDVTGIDMACRTS